MTWCLVKKEEEYGKGGGGGQSNIGYG